jgi:hypothetical protein
MLDPIAYYSPENHLFPALAEKFARTGTLNPEELYLILDWKASRARTRHRSRLVKIAGSFEAATQRIASDLHTATGPEQQMEALIIKWVFRLPTASAILAVLYPDTFTVYDARVCEVLSGFHTLGDMNWSHEAWQEYERFVEAVRATAPSALTLRDCDRWLWGRSKQQALRSELGNTLAT